MDLESTLAVAALQGLELSGDALRLIRSYRDTLYILNQSTNLTRVPKEEFDVRHAADSLLIAEFAPLSTTFLDIGSGPGFPSWIIAAARPDLKVTAIESQGKMVRMLSSIPLENLRIVEQRAEESVRRQRFGVVTGRAVAPFAVQTELSAAWVAIGGVYVPFRTPSERELIEGFNCGQLGLELESLQERRIPGSDVVRLFPVFRKVRVTPEEFPRAWGRIKSRPLGSSRPKA